MNKTSKFIGMDTHPSEAHTYTSPFHLVYNPEVAIFDKNTELEPGIHTGTCNYMVGGESSKPGKTVIQFIQIGRMTGDHIDTGKVVGDVELQNTDLENLIKMSQRQLERFA